MKIRTPHIPLNIPLEDALNVLRSVNNDIQKDTEEESVFYKVVSQDFECGFYEKDNKVIASWYNDPAGRDTEEGINLKVSLYLHRYGDIEDWEDGINNGWIQFFSNEKTKAGLAYGLHKDVLRFNFHG